MTTKKKKIGPDYICSPEKRGLDLFVTSTLAMVMGPLAVAACAGLKLELDRGPAVFIQERFGSVDPDRLDELDLVRCLSDTELMRVPKIRTMHGPVMNTASETGWNTDRAGRFGRLVRQSHVDETLQLWSVLCGDMSVVGPRPLATGEVEGIISNPVIPESLKLEWLWARTVGRPGLMSPVSKNQHDAGYELDTEEMLEADVKYVKEATFGGDLRIICDTMGAVTEDIAGKAALIASNLR